MNKFSKELIESLTEACEHAEGKPRGVGARVIQVSEVSSGAVQGAVARTPRQTAPRRRG